MTQEEIEQKNKEAENTANQNGSADETNKELEKKAEETASQSSDDKTKELEEERLRREGAEKKIVELKRKLKDAGVEENPDVNEIVDEALNKRLDALKAIASANEAKLQKENSELRETLKAKAGISNSSAGSNQAKPNTEEEIKFSAADTAFMQRNGLTAEDIKKNREKRLIT